jgi:hypothetical protein
MAGGFRQYLFNRGKTGHALNRSIIGWLTTRLWVRAMQLLPLPLFSCRLLFILLLLSFCLLPVAASLELQAASR